MIFVFGSNLQGIHGAGSALEAKRYWYAKEGQGVGLQGQAYAIPTKETLTKVIPIWGIKKYVNDFLWFAKKENYTQYWVTRIGCGLAGYKDHQIAPMFSLATDNVILCPEWERIIERGV